MPRISVVMSTYNQATYLRRAIDSVLRQSMPDFEFFIINDGSTDETEKVIGEVHDSRIVYLKNSENLGLVRNLNHGIKVSRGKYVARIDSDDWWCDNDKLHKQLSHLESHPNCALIGTWARVIDKNGREVRRIVNPITADKISKLLLIKNCFVHSSVLFRRDAVNVCGDYFEEEKFVEDYGLWLRLGEKYQLANLPEYSVGYLHNEAGETQSNNLKQIIAALDLIKRHKENYPNYLLAKIRWTVKYCLVYLGCLKVINNLK